MGEFKAGHDYTDSITVTTADGTSQVITVTIHGSNDAAVIGGTSTQELTETDAAQNTGGQLNASDVDGSAAFDVQTDVDGSNSYGKFTIAADGIVFRGPVLKCMIVLSAVLITHFPLLDIEGHSIMDEQRLEHINRLRVRHRVAISGIQPDRRRVTGRAM